MKFVKKINVLEKFCVVFLGVVLALAFVLAKDVDAVKKNSQGLSETQLSDFAQNDITFYNPGECVDGGSGTICGSTAREKYWSALGKYFDDPIQKAGIMGSISAEGQFSPTSWQCGNGMDSGGNFVVSWDTMFDSSYGNPTYIGVGSFGITSGLTKYLHWINDNTPNSIQYLKDPVKYAYNWCRHGSGYETPGDQTLEAMGAEAFDELVEHEVEYAMTVFNNTVTEEYKNEKFSTPSDAAYWWMDQWERPGFRNTEDRQKVAEQAYDDFKDFKCSSSSSGGSSGSSSGSGSSSSTGVKWDNGWIVEDSMDGAVKQDVNGKTDLGEAVNPVGSYTTSDGKPDKILLHNTQELGEGYDIYPAGNKFPAHFTIDLRNKKVWQHFSIYQPSLAVATYDKSGPIQIEIIGYTKRATKKDDGTFEYTEPAGYKSEWDLFNFKDEDWDYLAKLLLAISEETGIPLTSSVEWTPGTKNGLSKEQFLNYKGVLGHMHTPDNGSEDPSDIWQYVEAAINRQSNKCTTYDGDYPFYNQCDSKWSNVNLGNDETYSICGSGCGAASMAMLATVAAGKDIFPDDIVKLLGKGKYYDEVGVTELDPIVGDHYGFEVINETASTTEDAKTKFRDYLKKGYMIHFTGSGCYPGFILNSGKCSDGHVIGLYDIDSKDVVTQANSGVGDVNQKATLDEVVGAYMDRDLGVFTAIKGSGTTNACNDNICKSSPGSASLDGLTEEQAQKVADYYNSNEVTASNFIGGSIPSDCDKLNCVSFSLWFVSAFTDASDKGATAGQLVGDGAHIASTGLPSIGWKNGNDPTPYSVFGGAGSGAWTHTGVVVGTTSDGKILTIEAGYGEGCTGYNARLETRDPSYFSEGVGILAYPGEHLTLDKGHLGNKSLNEIIGG